MGKENVKYAFRLRNHGGRTSNGDGGLNTVKGPDNTTFTFSTCSLSFNGTTQTRGQIPHILYYSNPQDSESQHTSRAMAELQARKCTLTMTATIVQCCSSLFVTARERAEDINVVDILNESCIVNTLISVHWSPLIPGVAFAKPNPTVTTIHQHMLPHVAALNLMSGSVEQSLGPSVTCQDSFDGGFVNTTSQHYTWVQSDHPYKAATVSNYRVAFPETVKWLSLEFGPLCGTAQPEDCLQLYVPSAGISCCMSQNIPGLRVIEPDDIDSTPMPYWPVLHKFSSCNSQWPQSAVILPGNEVLFSLETASDYLKDDRANTFGFRCLVVGYEWPIPGSGGLRHLEAELAFLGGMCAASLMKKDLQLLSICGTSGYEETEGDVEIAEIVAQQTLATHGPLLSRGLALSSPPSVTQALDGILPFR